ncbi:serine hydrolase domain-containing protein [Verminephrobacter eiseniae]|uniref:serine hydrolase domain-containing protein n=1 Tax=Verminephrobacter eiseniae TaxID=364317 RepID=UPI0022384A9B|nr:serine hydrolase domain-containing protein [Verminephrobacter eiseniae]MCW5232090.1 class A beta-lactamase-related serine hydrolase [Verminephrobacter eiseniae]MCW5296348.1 class A beta-lactamase-related serine hydrolase [Verminephrobacter eiseniae]MCW8184039.1 class A beta-lactamase-related serine hydrolase [Verminephrobacter eiseniae]MCW8222642.1 class A beta-lactamase-related serine hydrolase [Verminephrobacter eiseniae]MCW8232959.1 class A beta-lactamase-related serine hydrolase [Vermin
MQAAADKLLKDAVANGDVPGVVAVATDAKGTIYEGGFGKRVLGQPAEMAPDTVVWIASMTKAITGAAAMQQVERGKLDLDAPAKAVIPYLGEVGVLEGFDAAGKPQTRKPRRDITLRHLLTHTAGLSYDIWSGDIVRYQQALGVPGITGCENKALTTPLLFDPGERWNYGINIDWVGKMIEAVSGKKLGQYLKENLLGPLGMDSTDFFIAPAMRERLAKIHHRIADGSLVPDMALEIPQQPEFEMGGGGLYGTAGDYLKFVRMMLNQGRSDRGQALLEPGTVAAMSRNAMGATRVVPLKSAIPPLSNDAEFFPGIDKQWGLSFMINNAQAPTGRSAGSLAWAGLANTYYWIDQKKGVGGVYATQILPFADVKSLPLYYAFEKTVYDA